MIRTLALLSFIVVAALSASCVHTLTYPATPAPTHSHVPSATNAVSPTSSPIETPSPVSAAPTASPAPRQQATKTPPPTPTRPVATETSPVDEGPTITYFRADTGIADPGDSVELLWESTGATSAQLYRLMGSGQLPDSGIDVPVSGAFVATIPLEQQNWVNYLLYIWDETGNHANATTSILLRCSYTWFFVPSPEDICPTAPVISAAAEQHFEGGTMIWIEAQDAIYVLTDTHWTRFEDRWNEGTPDQDPTIVAPPGRQQPVRGFGLVWRKHPEIQNELGWAVDGEVGYTAVLQRTTRYKYNAWYVLARDGRVWHLGPEGSFSRKLTTEVLLISPN